MEGSHVRQAASRKQWGAGADVDDLRRQLEEATNQSFSDAEELARLSAELDIAQQEPSRLTQQLQVQSVSACLAERKEALKFAILLQLPFRIELDRFWFAHHSSERRRQSTNCIIVNRNM